MRLRRKPALLFALLAVAIVGGDSGPARLSPAMRAEAQTIQPLFTAAILKGTCGFNAASTNVVRGSATFLHPASSFGTLEFDGISSVTRKVTNNNSGKLVTPPAMTGAYWVNADGRTGKLDFSASGGPIFSFVIGGGSLISLRYINIGPVDPKTGIVDFVTIATCRF